MPARTRTIPATWRFIDDLPGMMHAAILRARRASRRGYQLRAPDGSIAGTAGSGNRCAPRTGSRAANLRQLTRRRELDAIHERHRARLPAADCRFVLLALQRGGGDLGLS